MPRPRKAPEDKKERAPTGIFIKHGYKWQGYDRANITQDGMAILQNIATGVRERWAMRPVGWQPMPGERAIVGRKAWYTYAGDTAPDEWQVQMANVIALTVQYRLHYTLHTDLGLMPWGPRAFAWAMLYGRELTGRWPVDYITKP